MSPVCARVCACVSLISSCVFASRLALDAGKVVQRQTRLKHHLCLCTTVQPRVPWPARVGVKDSGQEERREEDEVVVVVEGETKTNELKKKMADVHVRPQWPANNGGDEELKTHTPTHTYTPRRRRVCELLLDAKERLYKTAQHRRCSACACGHRHTRPPHPETRSKTASTSASVFFLCACVRIASSKTGRGRGGGNYFPRRRGNGAVGAKRDNTNERGRRIGRGRGEA